MNSRYCARLSQSALATLCVLYAGELHAQHAHNGATRTTDSITPWSWQFPDGSARVGFMGIGLLSTVSTASRGRSLTEAYVSQPNFMADGIWKNVWFHGTINLEPFTLRRGELTPGIYGEGFIDRRHPHTLVHEVMMGVSLDLQEGLQASLGMGKGFASYGTDDPMMRPMVKYPVNHHHAQILERAQLVSALRLSRGGREISMEASWFNGDEPEGPFDAPSITRVGDSWASRLTIRPASFLEVQGSIAHVRNPSPGEGSDVSHNQLSLSVRAQRAVGQSLHVSSLAEYARTDEVTGDRIDYRFDSQLAELQLSHRYSAAAIRIETTERPETERATDPFRAREEHTSGPTGHGVTRWASITLQASGPAVTATSSRNAPVLVPFIEIQRARPTAVVSAPGIEPKFMYGGSTLWTYSIGMRLALGSMPERMGRYGVANATRANRNVGSSPR